MRHTLPHIHSPTEPANTAAHTPGPWFVQKGFLTIYNVSGGTSGLTCAIAGICKDQVESRAEAEANAHLIAAAPDLLEACAIMDAAVKAGHSNATDLLLHLLEAASKARAAIDKARGSM